MVTAKTQYNPKNAEQYFAEHLCVGDYYNEGQRVSGEWMGAGAERLGLSGKVRADDFLRLCANQNPSTGEKLTQNASAVVVSQTWTEVHRVNSRVRDALKTKGLLGAEDTTVQVLEGLDLTRAQKGDERFYPQDAVIVFNQKVREAEPGAKGKLAGILKSSVLVEVDGRFVTVSNKMLDRITVCQ